MSVHLQREVVEGASLRVSYVYKNLRKLDGEVDLGRVSSFTVPFSFVDAGPDNRVGTADDQRLNLLSTERRAPNRIAYGPILARANAAMPRDDADYQTLELAFNRSTRNNWMLTTSFSHTWAKEFTNVNARTGVRDFAGHEQTFHWNPNQRLYGRNESNYWNFKAIGRYSTRWGFSAASTYRLLSGYNWSRSISVLFPTAGSTTIPASAISDNRTPATSILDVRLEEAVNVGSGKILFVADLFNALNAGTVTNFRIGSGARFKEVIALLPPRAVRFGVEWRF